MKIDLPAMVIEQRVWNQLYVLQVSEQIEERIAWLGDKDFIARVREEPEDVGVALARTAGEHQGFWIDLLSARVVVLRDSFACPYEAFRLGIVVERLVPS